MNDPPADRGGTGGGGGMGDLSDDPGEGLVIPGHPKKLSIDLNNIMDMDPPNALNDDLFEPHPRQALSSHHKAPAAFTKAALVTSRYTPNATDAFTGPNDARSWLPINSFALAHVKTPPARDLSTSQSPLTPKATTTTQGASTVVSNPGRWSACGTQGSQEPRVPSSDGPPLAGGNSNKYDLLDSSSATTDNTAAAAATIAASAPLNTAVTAAPPAATNFTDIIFNSAAASAAAASAAAAPSSFSCASVGGAAAANISYAASNVLSPAVAGASAATRISSTASSITPAAAAAPSSLPCGAAAAAAGHHIIPAAAAASQLLSSCDPLSQLARNYCPLPAHTQEGGLLYSLVPPVHPHKRARPFDNEDKENDADERLVPEGAPPAVRARHENPSPPSSSLAAATSSPSRAPDIVGSSTFDPRIPSHQLE